MAPIPPNLRQLADRVPTWRETAADRGDRFARMNLTAGPIHVLGLARDEAAEMRSQCQRGVASWAQGGFHFQHLCARFTVVAADLYCQAMPQGPGVRAERCDRPWRVTLQEWGSCESPITRPSS